MAISLIWLILGTACQSIYWRFNPLKELGYQEVIHKDTVWKQGSSPYSILKDILILPDATLTIEPGVEITIGPDASIYCQGRIIAKGEPKHPIKITGQQGKPWGKIDCFGGRIAKECQDPTNIFRYCIVEEGHGIVARSCAMDVESCVFRNNISTPIRLEYSSGKIVRNKIFGNSTELDAASGNGGGIVVYTDKKVSVALNDVHDNISSGGRDGGGGIYAYAYDRGHVTISQNQIYRNRSDRFGGGLVAYSCQVERNTIFDNVADNSGGGIYTIRSMIRNNLVEGNTAHRGGGIYAEHAHLMLNSIANNTSPPLMGGGLFYYGEGRIEKNTFFHNGSRDEHAGESIMVSGNPTLKRNNIVGSLGHSLRVQTHSLAPDLDAMDNFWGTHDPEAICSLIYDWLDDTQIGLVNWKGFRTRWVPEAPPPPPTSLLWRTVHNTLILEWTYPSDIPISGFRIFWGPNDSSPYEGKWKLGPEDRSIRVSRPYSKPFFVRMSALRKGPEGKILKSAYSPWIRIPDLETQGLQHSHKKDVPVPLLPSRCTPPLGPIHQLRVSPDISTKVWEKSRWVISEEPLDFSIPVFDSGVIDACTSLPLPEGIVQAGRPYAWRVAFQDLHGNWTNWSPYARFCTSPGPSNILKGSIERDKTLGRQKGMTYEVTGNVIIPEDVSVNILPGTVFKISPDITFRVRGTLVAEGQKSRPIRFTGDPNRPWGRLFFEGITSSDTMYSDRQTPSKGILRYCVVENGHGILLEETGPVISESVIRRNRESGITIRNASAKILNNRILENHSPSNGGGIYAYGSKFIRISKNEILHNTAREDGGGVFAYGYHSTTAVNILDNLIANNQAGGDGAGVWASRSSVMKNRIISNKGKGKGGGMFATFALIEDNEISGNGAFEGGGIYAETNSSVQENRISGNRALGPFGGGVYLNFWGMSIKNEVFSKNIVTRNQAAPPGSNGGIYLNGSMIFEYNLIYENSGWQLFNANPSGRPPLTTHYCYWGTNQEKAIEAAIHDGSDDPGLAHVLFAPFATTPEKN